MMTTGRASPCTRLGLGGACHTDATPTFFPFPPSTRLALALPSPLPRYLGIQSWIVISSPPQNNALSFLLSRSQVPPLSSDFSHPLPDVSTNHISHATAKRHQSHHPIPSSHLRSQDPRPSSTKDLALSCPHLASPQNTFNSPRFFSPRLTFVSPPPCSPHSNCRPSMCSRHCQSPSPAHLSRVFSPVRYTDTSDRFKPGLPDSSLIPMHMLKCFRASRDALFVLSRRRTSFLFRLAALTSIAVSTPIWQLSASMHSSPPIRSTY